ncbi:MAG TPA: NAD(P)-dependent oxidoreductase [Gemmatimonadaceae bacterium]|nr:NAD(P)-dependent oxidoreductase [Gemmatimonadaceae bacterium]
MATIAFLGTGLLGSALAEAAAKRGDSVTVWNRTIEKARALEQFGIRVAETPADAVRGAERVHLVLKDDPVVEDVVGQLRSGLSPNAIIVDHTTTQPKATAERATRLNGQGVKYLHCPVFIGPAAARQTKGTILAAGPKALFDAVEAPLSKMAERVEYFGDRPDLAAVFKLCGNAFIVGINSVVADAFAVAKGADVDPARVLDMVEFFNPAAIISGRGRNMIARNFTPTFELTMARKDVRLMIETAGSQPLSALPCIAQRMDTMIWAGHGADDLAVLGKDSVS